MENPTPLEVDYDEQHNPEGVEHGLHEEDHGTLQDELSVTESSTVGYEDALPDAEESPDGIFWGILAACCFLAGLSIGLVLYFKSSFALTVTNWLHRCCPKLCRGTGQDPVLLTVVERQSKDGAKNEGVQGDEGKSEGSSSDGDSKSDGKCKDSTKAESYVSDGDAAEASAAKGEESEGQQGDGEVAASEDSNKENKDTNDGKEAKEVCENHRKSNSTSSSSSSSDNEDDKERSVRHRKKAAAEATSEGEAAPPPQLEDHGDAQHQE